MYLTLGQAAKETGKSKATLSKYIKNGNLSVVEKTEAGFKIDASELFRVFPKGKQQTGTNEQSQTPVETPVNSALNKEIELFKQRLSDKDDVINDLRKRLDAEAEERKRLTMLLVDMRPKAEKQPIEARKGFFGRLIGSKG